MRSSLSFHPARGGLYAICLHRFNNRNAAPTRSGTNHVVCDMPLRLTSALFDRLDNLVGIAVQGDHLRVRFHGENIRSPISNVKLFLKNLYCVIQ